MKVTALAAPAAKEQLTPTSIELGALRSDEVLIQVESCGICHSDLSMLNNEWGMSAYPFVAGHEVVGTIVEVGSEAKGKKKGDRVGLGWFSASCMGCKTCLSGDHNLCATAEQTMIGRPGGFATHVRAHWAWATPLPAGLDAKSAGPLFCGGITVFNPIVQNHVQPTDRVGVIGIGGLGHMALQFLNKWGCDVTAFTSSSSKAQEAKSFGAHDAVTSTDEGALQKLKGKFDFILVTANANLPWNLYLDALAPKGKMHIVGVSPAPISLQAFPLIAGQKSVSGSPLGSPATTLDMLEFCGRHRIAPKVEQFKMSDANRALAHLAEGKARYRIVLENDLA